MYLVLRLMLICTVSMVAYAVAVAAFLLPELLVVYACVLPFALKWKARVFTTHGRARWAESTDLGGMLDGE